MFKVEIWLKVMKLFTIASCEYSAKSTLNLLLHGETVMAKFFITSTAMLDLQEIRK